MMKEMKNVLKVRVEQRSQSSQEIFKEHKSNNCLTVATHDLYINNVSDFLRKLLIDSEVSIFFYITHC